jgi:tyrosyl-DNA phosphodiesterase 2
MATSKPADIMKALTATLNSGPPAHRGADYHEPKPQHFYYVGEDGTWKPWHTKPKAIAPTLESELELNPKIIRLISWNIDVLTEFAEERMQSALQYLETLVSSSPRETPVVVFLQEMGQSDMQQIRHAAWIMERFHITDIDNRNWLSSLYGTSALIDRRLMTKNIFRVPWISRFDRDGLFIDVALSKTGEDEKLLRLCNTHLESLVADPPVRPTQLTDAATFLGKPEVAAGLLAGDLNAIQPFDRELHSANGLKDAYLELGGTEDCEDGYTWGHQVPQWMKDKFGCSRMDKILFRGALQPSRFERIGMGVKVADDVREKVAEKVEGGFVTDHYGVMGDLELVDGWELSVQGPLDSML